MIDGASKKPNRMRFFRGWSTAGAPFYFLIPALLLIVALRAWPVIRSVDLSFRKWNGFSSAEWIGLSNYTQMLFHDVTFYRVFGNTLVYSFIASAGSVVLGFFLAYAIYRRVPGWSAFKIIFFVTYVLSQAATAVVWKSMLDPLLGPVIPALRFVGLDPPIFLGDPNWALVTIAIKSVWQYSAVPMLIFLAAMEDIPRDIIEAARLEGANNMRILRRIILPLTRPVILILLLLQFVFSMKSFDSIWVMTQGGPGKASSVLGTEVFLLAFEQSRFGYASAWAVALTALVGVLTIVYLRLLRQDAVEH